MLNPALEVVQVENLVSDYKVIIESIDGLYNILKNGPNEHLERELEMLNHQKEILEFYLLPENIDAEIILRKTFDLAINNIFLYFIIKSDKVNNLILKFERHNIAIPKSKFKKALKFLSEKEKKIVEKSMPYETYIHAWENNKEDIIEDYHWMFASKKMYEQFMEVDSVYMPFDHLCHHLGMNPNVIRKCFNGLRDMNTEQIIEKYLQYKELSLAVNKFVYEKMERGDRYEFKL